jgi:multicomponent Na+:H+ antiporter subunit G
MVLLGLSVAIVALSVLGALRMGTVFARLHFVTPITSLAAPLFGLALAIENGWGLTAATILLTVFVLAATGPVIQAATGRLAAEHEGITHGGDPE